jgi:hypothetical protein
MQSVILSESEESLYFALAPNALKELKSPCLCRASAWEKTNARRILPGIALQAITLEATVAVPKPTHLDASEAQPFRRR